MPYSPKQFTCPDCGTSVTKRAAAGAVVTCVPCGVARSAENARQLHAHSGVYYDRWTWAYLTAMRRLARELPPSAARKTA